MNTIISMTIRVRAPQKPRYISKNSKIPEELFHKLWFHPLRIEFQCLFSHPFNFKIYGIFEIFLAIITEILTTIFSKWEFVLKGMLSASQRLCVVWWSAHGSAVDDVKNAGSYFEATQSYQIKIHKYYRYCLEYANISKSPG